MPPKGGNRTLAFATDVENDFFDRTDDPGDLSLAFMLPSSTGGGHGKTAASSEEGYILDVVRTNPSEGTIKVGLRATGAMKAGDTVSLSATLARRAT